MNISPQQKFVHRLHLSFPEFYIETKLSQNEMEKDRERETRSNDICWSDAVAAKKSLFLKFVLFSLLYWYDFEESLFKQPSMNKKKVIQMHIL